MVSLSTNEMLRQMVENYGFGVTLFELTTLEQLEVIKKMYPVLEIYIDDLMSGKIYDPDAKSVLLEKYNDNRWINPPRKYELEIPNDVWKMISDIINKENITQTQYRVTKQINLMVGMSYNPEIDSEPISNFKKGDVLYVYGKYQDIKIEAYYILDKLFENVYFKYNDLIVADILSGNFNMLVDTPADFWNQMKIPELQIQYDLSSLFEQIKWSKIEKSGQNYLVGRFSIKNKKQFLYIPIPKTSQSANILAIALKMKNLDYFYPVDPRNIIPSGPNILFADSTNDTFVINLDKINED